MADLPKLRLYNTLTKAKEDFAPLDANNVRMYVCGPTVYDFAHIGNARPVIVFDVLYRLLRHLYGEKHVTYVRNITDIDDKINKRAFERWNRKGSLLDEVKSLTQTTAAQYEADVAALGCLPPTHSPRATAFVCDAAQPMDMVRVIEKLVAKGHAYAAEGHVLFHVPSMPNYGKLSRRPLDDMIAGARVEVAPYKKDPMDFVLWKPSDPATEPGWDSPWGYGRPGWHIECSAMSGALLGEQFDIHAGGIDLIFPHHENEIAQSCCAFGNQGEPLEKMASVWMHNGFLQVEGQKMSKSLGNFVTIREVLKDWPGEVVRLNMLKTHYRQPIDWTVRGLEESASKISKYKSILWDNFGSSAANLKFWADLDDWSLSGPGDYYEMDLLLNDDLNTPMAVVFIDGLVTDYNRNQSEGNTERMLHHAKWLAWNLNYLGLVNLDWFKIDNERQIQQLITARLEARATKNFAESDRIRDELLAIGIQLKDGKDPVTGDLVTTWEVKK
jgi:cysteinyl-tRNA synthetase